MRVIPPEIPIEAAVLLCTWREVYAAFVDFNLQAGQDVLIYGAGPVGLSFTRMARLLGLDYIGVVEFSEMKRELARQFGASDTFSPEDHRLYELVKSRGRPLDAVIDAVGKEAIINSALPLVKMGGSICVYGVIDQAAIQVQKNRGPYNFNLLFHQWPTRSREAAAQEPLCEWIAQGKLDYQDFISAEFSIYEINQAIELTRTGKTIKTLLRF
jgi:threonine dehydrogenase-like Zn-dependent dehydrogenase